MLPSSLVSWQHHPNINKGSVAFPAGTYVTPQLPLPHSS